MSILCDFTNAVLYNLMNSPFTMARCGITRIKEIFLTWSYKCFIVSTSLTQFFHNNKKKNKINKNKGKQRKRTDELYKCIKACHSSPSWPLKKKNYRNTFYLHLSFYNHYIHKIIHTPSQMEKIHWKYFDTTSHKTLIIKRFIKKTSFFFKIHSKG